MNLRDYIKKIIKEELDNLEDELDEATTTSSVAGFNIPTAFKRSSGKNPSDVPDTTHTDRINKSTGYVRVTENRWLEIRKDESSPKKKIARGIADIKQSLYDIEKKLEWYSKIKEESGVSGSDYWINTKKNLKRIRERVNKIALKLDKL